MLYQRVTLPNGLRILSSQMTSVRSVSVAFYFGVGARYEEAEVSGVSHFIEHMLFKGSAQYPTAQAISEAIEGVGGVLDAATDKELTVFSAKVASRHFDLAMNLLADMVRRPRLDPVELEKERRVIIEELGMYRDSPQEWVGVLADEVVWPDLPLGREVAGTRETVSAISLDQMDAYRRAHYAPNNLVISVVGDVTSEQVMAAVERLLGDWEAAPSPVWLPCPQPAGTPRVKLETRRTEQTNLCLVTPGLAHNDPNRHVLTLLNAILGDGMASRLFLEVRERQGLAYDVSSSPVAYHDTGMFVVYAGVEPKRTAAALRAILAELGRIRAEAPPVEELSRAKEYIKGRMALGLESTGSVASWLGGQEILLDEILDLDDVLARIDAVTQDDVQRLAQRLFQDEWLRLAVIGPQKNAEELDRLLKL
ncbi:MAG: pitrilysin family protein [Ktedonobacterales bacterium]